MRLFISGSAPLLAETHKQFEQRTGHRILERYGMTETNMITSNPYSGARRAGTVGHPLPGIEVKITDPKTGKTLRSSTITPRTTTRFSTSPPVGHHDVSPGSATSRKNACGTWPSCFTVVNGC